jgi:type VI secretion system protein ImpL
MTLGLYQGDKLDAAAMLTHQRALNDAFLPQIAKRIEDQLRTAQKDNLEYTYEALKSYLMLYQPEHFDAEALKAWITLDWARSLDRGIPEDQRKALEDQLDVLIAQGPPRSPLKMDENLVRSVRAVLASYPLEQRVFSRLKRQRASKDIPGFSVATAAGPSGPLVFERISGKPLTEGVPGMFTYDGYHKRFQNEVTVLTGLLAAEDPWVLGQDKNAADRLRDVAALGALTDRVRRLYLEEYVKQWEALLADVRLIRANGLEKNIETARILSGVGSPLAAFLRAVVKETTLIPLRHRQGRGEQGHRDRAQHAQGPGRSVRRRPRQAGGAGQAHREHRGRPLRAAAPPRHRCRAQPARADRRCAQALQRGVRVPECGRHGREGPHVAAARRRGRQAQVRRRPPARAGALHGREPEPVGRGAGPGGRARQPEPGPAARDRVLRARHRGPLSVLATSKRDVLPEDFGQMFGAGGLMDDFFQKRLAALVDTSTRPWRYKPWPSAGPSPRRRWRSSSAPRASRTSSFARVAAGPSMRLDFKPVEMDAGITQFILDVDGQLVKYAHGPVVPMAVQWPGPKGSNQVRIQVSPPSTTGSSGSAVDGPWALFRALDDGQLEAGDAPEKFFITFQIGARKTRFEVTTNSVQHPIRLRELREFSCPEGL